MNFLTETIWVMIHYGNFTLASGFIIATALSVGASRLNRLTLRIILLALGGLVLWAGLFMAADSGYRLWQNIPHPPEEAFSDTGPIFFLLAGWLPSALFILAVFWISSRLLPRPLEPSL